MMTQQVNEEEVNQWCFVCGPKNPIGLKLNFQEENESYVSHFTAGPQHQGYDGIVHGGIISTLLDEITARYIYAKGFNAVTARLEVRYRHPTPIGQPLTIVGRIIGQRGKMFEMSGKIQLTDGTVTAEAKAMVAVIGEMNS